MRDTARRQDGARTGRGHRALGGPLLLILAACAGPGPQGPTRDPGPTVVELWVDPGGRDDAAGTLEDPLRSVAAALSERPDVVHLLPGVHRGSELLVSREVRILGAPTATVSAHVFVSGDAVQLRGLELLRGLGVGLAREVRLDGLRVRAGDRPEALSLHRAEVELIDVAVEGGEAASLQVTASTVGASALRIDGRGTQRALRIDGGRVRITRGLLDGGAIATVQATRGSTLSLAGVHIHEPPGSGIVALDGSRVRVERSFVRRAGRMGLLARRARLEVSGSTLSAVGGAALGLTGAYAEIRGGRLGAGDPASVVLSGFRGTPAKLRMSEVQVAHGARSGLLVGAGAADLQRVRFVGLATSASSARARSGEPAALLHGPAASARLTRTRFLRPAGPALEAHEGASVTLEAVRVNGAGDDGVRLEGIEGPVVTLTDLSVSGCGGAGVRAVDVTQLRVRGLDVEGCAEAGLVAAGGTRGRLTGSRLSGAPWGVAAFGGARLAVGSSSVAASRWSLFASCADGAAIEDLGDNRLAGSAVRCP